MLLWIQAFGTYLLVCCMVTSFNIETKRDQLDLLVSPVIKSASESGTALPKNVRSSFYGHSIGVASDDPKRFFITAPKMKNGQSPSQQGEVSKTPTNFPAQGSVEKCQVSLSPQKSACDFAGYPNASVGDNFGLSMSVGPRLEACSPTKSLNCSSSKVSPGVCYRSRDGGDTWDWVKQRPPKCQISNADVLFVLDGSHSVGNESFKSVKNWISNLSTDFDIESGSSQIGVIQYSHYYPGVAMEKQPYMETAVELGKFRSVEGLKDAVDDIDLHGYTTYSGRALEKSLIDFQNYSRWDDGRITKIMILLTDGKADDDDILEANANRLRSLGIVTFAVGVAKFEESELRTIATGNTSSDERVFSVSSFSALSQISQELSDQIRSIALEGSGKSTSTEFNMELSQRGFSMSNDQNGRLYLGAVGAYDWSGTVTKYDTMDDTTADIPTYAEVQKVLPNRTKESYMGYSVTTGTFNDGTTEYVATGAPRYKLMGAVVIYKPLNNDNKFNDHVRLMGHPSKRRLGSYFGGSVLALDVNNDNRDDLLVGAPLYVNESYDEGRVFVYVSQTTNTLGEWAKNTYKPIELVGDNLPGGRFGTAIANAGDLNKDGYNDVIIGAPLVEGDRGAVFIYHGSADGVDPMFKQKILASQLTGVTLKYFGQSLQGAVDLDSNGYPDIAVGAPKSDTVVIFRSRPVVNIAATIGFAGTSAIDIFECILDKKYVNCTTIEVCFRPTGDSIEDQIGMKFNVSMDARKADAEKRLEFRDNNEKTGSAKFTWSSVVALKKSKQSCFTQQVHMKTNVKDYDASVIAEVEYDLTEAHTAVAMSSVRDPTKSNKQSASLNFTKNCVGTCDPDLNVVMTLNVPKYPKDAPPEKDLSKNKKVFVIHSEMAGTPLPVHVNLSNFGENAFDAKVRIKYTDVITLRNVVIRAANPPSNSCVVEDSSPADENGLRTQILRYNSRTNIMPSNTYCYFEFSLIMDPLRNNGSLDNFVVEVEAFISGSTKEKDTSNNRATRTTELDYISDMTLKQGATPDISFNDTTEDTRNITSITEIGNGTENAISTFTVTGNGYSNIPNVGVTLDFPMMTPDNEMLLYLYDVQCKIPNSNRRIACSCDMDQVNRYNLSLGAPQQSTENVSTTITPVSITKRNTPMDTYQYSCLNKNTTGCRTVNCRIKNLGQRDEVIFEAHYRVWTDSLMFNSSNNNEKIELRSNFKITTSQSPNILDENGVRPIVKTEESIINVRLFSAISGPAPVADNLWIYIVAAIGGLLLLIALVLILWKLGFFKSKYADMKKGAEEDLQEETEFPDQNGK